MQTIIGVRFKHAGKIYYFTPGELEIASGQQVIVETARGVECGTVVVGPREAGEGEGRDLPVVHRLATQSDLDRIEENKEREKEAFGICEQKIRERSLPMKLVNVEYTFDMGKIIFYFTADGRIDFRELVKDLAAVFRTRIELRQIGVRDEAKLMGGAPVLRLLPGGFRAGIHPHGEGAEPVPESHEDFRHLRPPDVLPEV